MLSRHCTLRFHRPRDLSATLRRRCPRLRCVSYWRAAFCGELTRCTPPVAWCADDGVVPLVRGELSSTGSCWLPTTAPLRHITWDARRRSALRSSCTSADSTRRPSRCAGASGSSELPNWHAPTLFHLHIGPFLHGTQAGIDIERDLLHTRFEDQRAGGQ